MGKCPKCKRRITHLNNWRGGESKYRFEWDADSGVGTYDLVLEMEENGRVNDFECPNCERVIAKSEEKALKGLEG